MSNFSGVRRIALKTYITGILDYLKTKNSLEILRNFFCNLKKWRNIFVKLSKVERIFEVNSRNRAK